MSVFSQKIDEFSRLKKMNKPPVVVVFCDKYKTKYLSMPNCRRVEIFVPGSRFFIVDDIRSSCYPGQIHLDSDRDRCQVMSGKERNIENG